MKIILGGAQFGIKYGSFNNKTININELKKITNLSIKNKISIIDTSFNYKNSHHTISELNLKKFKIITKIKLDKKRNIKYLYNMVTNSLKKLKIKNFYSILIHDYKDLLSKNGKFFLKQLYELKKNGLVKKIGISIYCPGDLRKIWNFWKPEIIQAPLNVFDRRIVTSGWLKKIKKNKIQFIARSIFLQGLLLNDLTKNCKNYSKFRKHKNILGSWLNWCKKKKISPVKGCLDYVKKFSNIDYIVLGFNSFSHFKQILGEYNKKKDHIPNTFNSKSNNLIDPRKWSLKN